MAVEGFDSFDEMMEHLYRRMDDADARVQPWQAAIKAGEYFQRDSRLGFNIYGEVLHEDEPREEHVKNYRFCRCYSVACPTGEMGDVHVSTTDNLIKKTEYDEAKARGWQ